jgi:hypothetical protein
MAEEKFDIVEINCDPQLADEEGILLASSDPRRITTRAFTAKEKAQHEKDQAEAVKRLADEKVKKEQLEKDIAAIKERAKQDSDFAALVRLLKV